jgi:hypothetical protein
VWLLLVASGCIDLDLDSQPHLILDYLIDKPRVVAVRAVPPVVEGGSPMQLDALVLAPGEGEPRVTASVCGLRLDVEVDVDGVVCFDNRDLVEEVATELPAVWTPPDLSGARCDPEDFNLGEPCASEIPLMVEAELDGVVARASVGIGISVGPPSDLRVPIPMGLLDPGPVRAGDEVTITVVSSRAPVALDHVAWWVDAGVLLGTGRTRTYGQDDILTENTLVIPDDWEGPLTVAAVGVESGLTPLSWDVIELQVLP